MLRFPRDIKLDFLSSQIENLGSPEANSIQVPAKIPPESGFAVTGILIQLLAQWSRRNRERILHVAGQPVQEMLYRLSDEPHGSAAIYFAREVSGALGFSLESNRARRFLIPKIRAMQNHQYRETIGSRGVHLCCFSGSINEYLNPFYGRSDDQSLRNSSEFIDLIRNILNAFEPTAERKLSYFYIRFIASIIFELFSNTHDHARMDEDGNKYSAGNVRGLIARTIEFREDRRETSINTHVHRYMIKATIQQRPRRPSAQANLERAERIRLGHPSQSPFSNKSKTSTRFLEFTIYDTGPGLANNWAKKKGIDTASFSFEEELRCVTECFAVGSTTKQTHGVGQGLFNTLQALEKLGAFMVLRTGRTFLYQDFLNHTKKTFSPEHWHPDEKEQPYLPGTAYTIVVPLNRREA